MRWICSITISAALVASASATTPKEATASVGKEVKFSAEIKSITHSDDGLYLIFDDSYPVRLVSARIPADRIRLAEKLPLYAGRVVEVSGLVKARSGGNEPIIDITQSEQIRVQPLDTTGVLEETGEGSVYSQRVMEAVESLLLKSDFDALEKLAARWTAEKSRTTDGLWKLSLFFNALDVAAKADTAAFRTRIDQLNAWQKAKPGSVVAATALGNVLTSYAWNARGSDYAHAVPDWAWKLFRERLAEARTALESAKARRFECPHWFAAMQTVALGQGWDRKDYDDLFAEAVKCEPGYLQFYFSKAYWLLPRWFGEPGEWEKFALSTRNQSPGGKELYARICWSASGAHRNIFLESGVQWPLMKEGFEEMMKHYPNSRRNLNYFALYAGRANDRETCKRLFAQIENAPDMTAWYSPGNIVEVRKWLADPHAPAPKIFRLEKSR